MLAITGGHDVQVPPEDVARIGGLVKGPFEGHVVGDLSHVLRPDPDSAGPRKYRRAVRQPVSPEVLPLLVAWVRSHWNSAPTTCDDSECGISSQKRRASLRNISTKATVLWR